MGAGAPAPLPHGAHPGAICGTRPAGADSVPSPRAGERVGVSGWHRRSRPGHGPLPARRGRRVLCARRAAAAPARPGACRGGTGPGEPSAGPCCGPRCARRRRYVFGCPAVAAGRPDRARAGRPAPARGGPHQAPDRRRPGDLAVNGSHAHGAHLRQVRRLDQGWPGDVRDAARPRGHDWSGRRGQNRLNSRYLRAVPAAYGSWQAITSDSAKGAVMTASTGTTSTATITDVDVVRAVFGAFASGDLAALSDLLHADATWHHHNDDRLGGVHRGADAVVAYLTESALLTAGTLHAEPQSVMADGQGHVAVPVRLSASRPDGRTMDGPQVLLVTVEGGRVRAIEQFIGDPAAVAAFWA